LGVEVAVELLVAVPEPEAAESEPVDCAISFDFLGPFQEWPNRISNIPDVPVLELLEPVPVVVAVLVLTPVLAEPALVMVAGKKWLL
jgi:hypothetical protein